MGAPSAPEGLAALCCCWGEASSEMPFVNSQELFCATARAEDDKSANDGWLWLCSLTSPPRAQPLASSIALLSEGALVAGTLALMRVGFVDGRMAPSWCWG